MSRGEAGGRKSADGVAGGEQVLAANVDAALIVCGLDRDFNLRRIERYAALAYGGGVTPTVVLNKADIADDPLAMAAEVEASLPGA